MFIVEYIALGGCVVIVVYICIQSCRKEYNAHTETQYTTAEPSDTQQMYNPSYREDDPSSSEDNTNSDNEHVVLPVEPETHLPYYNRTAFQKDFIIEQGTVCWEISSDDIQQTPLECVICLDSFHVGDVVRRLPCLHQYHRHCIDTWFSLQHTIYQCECPICHHSLVTTPARFSR